MAPEPKADGPSPDTAEEASDGDSTVAGAASGIFSPSQLLPTTLSATGWVRTGP